MVLWSSRFHSHWRDLLESLARLRFAAAVAGALTLGRCWAVRRLAGRCIGQRRRESPEIVAEAAAHTRHGGALGRGHGVHAAGPRSTPPAGFQALYGYVYQQLAILVALFMVGMAGGAWLALRETGRARRGLCEPPTQARSLTPRMPYADETRSEYRKLALLQLLAAASASSPLRFVCSARARQKSAARFSPSARWFSPCWL